MKKKLLGIIITGLAIFSLASCKNQAGIQDSTTSSNVGGDLVNIDIYGVNDFHGTVKDTNKAAGIEKTSTYLKDAMSKDTNPIFISQGDMWQGSSESNNTKGKLVTEWMNDLNCVSMTLGNHEYDWGDTYIKEAREVAKFPFLGINVIDRATNERASYCDSSVMIERSGVKIGIIGAIGDCYSSIASSMVSNVEFKVKSDLTQLVKDESTKLKKDGADFIIFSIHDSNEAFDNSLSYGYVDLVLEGHSHSTYKEKDSNGVYHVQAGGYNDSISHIDINYNKKTKKLEINTPEMVDTKPFLKLDLDSYASSLFVKYSDMIGDINSVLGYNNANRDSNYLRNLVASLYLEKGLEQFSNYDIVLGGGYISCRSPYNLPSGEVTYSKLQSLFPFDNDLCLCSISGYNLLNQFIETTNNNYFIAYSDYGNNIRNSISTTGTYYIMVDTYSADYAPNGCTIIDKVSENGMYARDLLAEYAKAGKLGKKATNTVHAGTLTDPYDINDAKTLCEATGDTLAGPAYFTGVVKSVEAGLGATTGGLSFTISNGTVDVFCYYINKSENATLENNWASDTELKAGDEVVIYAKYTIYNGSTYELKNGYVVSINKK